MTVVAGALATVMVGSTVPSGLYTLFQQRWGLPVATTAIVFASYIAGVLLALRVLGHLADQRSKKQVMIASLGVIAGQVRYAVGG